MERTKTWAYFERILAILGGIATIIGICNSLGFDLEVWKKESWEGCWKMEIGSQKGETEILFREEKGNIIGAYVIKDKGNGKILCGQMSGVDDKGKFTGNLVVSSDTTIVLRARFDLTLQSKNTFSGTYYVIQNDGSRTKNYDWTGTKCK